MYDANIRQPEWLVKREEFDRWVNVLADNDNNLPFKAVISPVDEFIGSGLLSFY